LAALGYSAVKAGCGMENAMFVSLTGYAPANHQEEIVLLQEK